MPTAFPRGPPRQASPSVQPQQALATLTCVRLFGVAASVCEGDSLAHFSLRAYCVPGTILEATRISGDLEAGAGERARVAWGTRCNRRVIMMEAVAASY